MRRFLVPLIFGLGGFAVLVSLGIWQLQRLAWKEAALAEIEARIGAAPQALPADPDPEADRYMPVAVAGAYDGRDLPVLVSLRRIGPAWRLIAAMQTDDGRRILVDRGWVAPGEGNRTVPAAFVQVTGNLHWPDEVDRWTPEPDPVKGLWFARDVDAMAAALDTEPVLVIAREETGAAGTRPTPLPVSAEGIPNNHLGYAVQWFGLAIVWAGMTAFLLWRIHRRRI